MKHLYKVGQSGVYNKCRFSKLEPHNMNIGKSFTITVLRAVKSEPYVYGQAYIVSFGDSRDTRVVYESEMQMNPARNIPWL